MVISDLRMETEEAGLEVLRAARRQAYDPATALLTAYPPSGERFHEKHWDGKDGKQADEKHPDGKIGAERTRTRC